MSKQFQFALRYAIKYLQGLLSNDGLKEAERKCIVRSIHELQSIVAPVKLPF